MHVMNAVVNNEETPPLYPRLRDERWERKWSQQELADRIGVSAITISRWENSSVFPSPYYRQRLSEVFGKTSTELGLRPPLLNVPRIKNIPIVRNHFFTGREDLLALLHERLARVRTAALTQPQALYGLGGIGKTQTAAEYAFRYGDDYDQVFWIRAASRETLVADFVTLAELLALPEKNDRDQQRSVAAVKRWLGSHEGWLLILDNADDLILAQEFVPTRHKGYVLFTTRAPAVGDIAASVEVEQLSLHDGMVLLLYWTKRLSLGAPLDQAQETDRIAAEGIVREMDGLPLAIVQAAAFVEETNCDLTDYLDLYTTRRKSLLARSSRLVLNYPETVATTWSLSFQAIEQQSPAAADILRLCAFLAPDAIPEELFTRGAAELGTVTGSAAADPLKLNETLEVLCRYSLVRRNEHTKMLSLHRLVQTVLKESMDEPAQRAWAERTVRVVNAALPEAGQDTGETYRAYLPHIQECAALIEAHQLHFPQAAQLLYRAGAMLYYHGFHPQAQSFHQQALAIREQVCGADHPDVAESLNSLAILARNQGDYEHAERFHQRALAIRKQVFGPEDPLTLESLNNLAVVYRTQGKYEQAEPLFQQVLRIREQPAGFRSSQNLAFLYQPGKTLFRAAQV